MIHKLSERHARIYSELAPAYESARFHGAYGEYDLEESRELIRELVQHLGKGANCPWKALDVACGTGRAAIQLAVMGASVSALDITSAMLAECSANAEAAGVSDRLATVQASADCMPFPDEYFDIVFSFRFLHLFPPTSYRKLIAEMLRVTKPDGHVAVEFKNSRYIFGLRNRSARCHGQYPVSLRVMRRAVTELGAKLVCAPGLMLPRSFHIRNNRVLAPVARWLAHYPLQGIAMTRVAVFSKRG